MDYETLLRLAKKNSENKNEVKRALPNLPPISSADHSRKQEVVKKKLLDANVARFLAKRQEEERKKQSVANQKREELLALRNQDAKARKRVKIMNKSAKSADKSAIQDAIGPSDYYIIEEPLCFISQEALAQEEKFLEKMYNGPEEEKFCKGKKNTNKDLIGTKDRVRQALKLGDVPDRPEKHRERKRDRDSKEIVIKNDVSDDEEPQRKEPRKPRPPPMNYMELLKLAEKLQQEPMKEAPVEKDTATRPMTKKEREEYLLEEASRKRKEAGWKEEAYLKKMGKLPPPRGLVSNTALPRIPKKTVSEVEERSSSSLPRIPKHVNSSAVPAQSQKSLNIREASLSSKQISRQSPVPPSVDKSKQISRQSPVAPSVDKSKTPTVRQNGLKQNIVKAISAPRESSCSIMTKEKNSTNISSTKKAPLDNSLNINRKRNKEFERSTSVHQEVPRVTKPALSSQKTDHEPPFKVPPKSLNRGGNKCATPIPIKNTKLGKNCADDSVVNTSRQLQSSELKFGQNSKSVNKPASSASRQPSINIRQPASSVSRQPSNRQPTSLDSKHSSDVRSKLPVDIKSKQSVGTTRPGQLPPNNVRSQLTENVKSRQDPSNTRAKQFPPADVQRKQFPPSDVRPKQFPPADLGHKQFPPADVRDRGRIKANMKRRIIESDDEYDSEDAAFIDDGPDQCGEDYSKYIKEIFGYDKNRYKGIDDSDDRCMESSFQQQLKEEFTSTKLGIMEDLEDIQKEKRREALLKKKRKLK